ncbi:MAG: DEAD/DEAH box helicase [Actinobacteria bacterium]|nr:DEAD/DEAH box helicase [Actinomycetota bacterium]
MITTEEQLNLFISLFRGRTDVFARRWEKDGKSGYAPAYKFDWDEYLLHKAKGGNFQNFKNKEKIPLSKDVIKKHLIGAYFIGIYPLLEDNTSYFIVIDLDGKNWEADCKNFIGLLNQMGISAHIERSFSGNGCHIWIFFEDKYPAVKGRKIFLEFSKIILNLPEFEKEISFDRLFSNQDSHSGMGFGNLIALPLQGKMVQENKMVFLDHDNLLTISNQWKYMQEIKKISIEKLDKVYSQLFTNNSLGYPSVADKKEIFEPNILNITLRNQIILNKNNMGKKVKDFLKKNLIFINSEYLIKQKIKKSTFGIQKFFNLITESENEVRIPRGFLNNLVNFCDENEIKFKLFDKRKKLKNIDFSSKVRLLGNQEIVLDCCENIDSGIIVAPPGFGKTIIGIELISRKKQPALILVHRKQIYDQWLQRIENFLSINKKDIGQICGNKKNFSNTITVTMIQSLLKLPNLKDIDELFGTIIVDECHHIPAKSFRQLITNFNPYYIYGLTATPKRKYNDEKLIFFYIGDIICDVANIVDFKEDKTENKILIEVRKTDLDFPYDNKTDDFQLLSKVLIYDSGRNKLISKDVLEAVSYKHKVLILTERKEHADVLYAFLKSYCEVISITGDDSISSRKIKLQQINTGNFQVLITTGQLLGEGFDIESINCLFLVFPFSFEGKLIQYIGRILRFGGKKLIYDYRDIHIEFLEKLYKKREKYYRKMGK